MSSRTEGRTGHVVGLVVIPIIEALSVKFMLIIPNVMLGRSKFSRLWQGSKYKMNYVRLVWFLNNSL